MVVMVGTIALLCDLFRRRAWWMTRGSRSGKGKQAGAAAAVFLLLAVFLSILAPFFAKLISGKFALLARSRGGRPVPIRIDVAEADAALAEMRRAAAQVARRSSLARRRKKRRTAARE